MGKFRKFIPHVLLLSFMTLLNPPVAPALDSVCGTSQEKRDPYAPDGIMASGKHAGECLDIDHFRSFRRLTLAEVSENASLSGYNFAKYDFISNVQHENRFWIAVLPKNAKVVRTVFLVEPFPPEWIAAHTELRFDFDEDSQPILFNQVGPVESVKLSSLVLSSEAAPLRNGPTYNLYSATKDYFVISRRLMSIPQVLHQVRGSGHEVDQYLLRLSVARNGDEFWKFSLDFFHDPEMKAIYHTLYRNCSNSIFEGFDVFYQRPRPLWERAATTLPFLFRVTLQERGLLEKTVKLPKLTHEFP